MTAILATLGPVLILLILLHAILNVMFGRSGLGRLIGLVAGIAIGVFLLVPILLALGPIGWLLLALAVGYFGLRLFQGTVKLLFGGRVADSLVADLLWRLLTLPFAVLRWLVRPTRWLS